MIYKTRNSCGAAEYCSRIALVIFDCDGVMFDSRSANEAFYNQILFHFGLPPLSQDQLEYVHMATTMESVDHIISDPGMRPAAQAFRESLDYTPFTSLMAMEPELVDLLEHLQGRVKTAVATNRSQSIVPLLEQFGLDRYFDRVVSCLDVPRPKPFPDSLLLILDQLDIPPDRAVFIGDSSSDEGAAQAAGIPFIAYRNPGLEAWRHIRHLGKVKEMVSDPSLF